MSRAAVFKLQRITADSVRGLADCLRIRKTLHHDTSAYANKLYCKSERGEGKIIWPSYQTLLDHA